MNKKIYMGHYSIMAILQLMCYKVINYINNFNGNYNNEEKKYFFLIPKKHLLGKKNLIASNLLV